MLTTVNTQPLLQDTCLTFVDQGLLALVQNISKTVSAIFAIQFGQTQELSC